MVDAVVSFLRSHDLRVVTAVPFMSQCIDLVYETPVAELVAVEFKKHDWRRAVEQSKTHLLGADRVYICLPGRSPSESLMHTLHNYGIGLFLYRASEADQLQEHLAAREVAPRLQFPKTWLRTAFEQRHAEEKQ